MYENRLVCWIDLLGFKDWIEQTQEDSHDAIEKIKLMKNLFPEALKYVHDIHNSFNEAKVSNSEHDIVSDMSHFSDTIIISRKFETHKDIESLFMDIYGVCVYLLFKNMPFRGAIVIGKLLHSNEQVFGPAINEAYDLETSCAIYPRIIVSESLLSIMKNTFYLSGNTYCDQFLSKDNDFIYYFDYIQAPWINKRGNLIIFVKNLLWMRKLIESNSSKTLKVLMKYNWLGRKHDECLKKLSRITGNIISQDSEYLNDQELKKCIEEILRMEPFSPEQL